MQNWKEKAAQLRAEMEDNHRRQQESWERSDTDGFLSQAANGAMAHVRSLQISICEREGKAHFVGLWQGERRVKAKQIETKFGTSWVLHEDEVDLIAKRGKPFLPVGMNSRIHKQLGIEQFMELAPAWAKCAGFHGGATFRTGCKWGSDAQRTNAKSLLEIDD